MVTSVFFLQFLRLIIFYCLYSFFVYVIYDVYTALWYQCTVSRTAVVRIISSGSQIQLNLDPFTCRVVFFPGNCAHQLAWGAKGPGLEIYPDEGVEGKKTGPWGPWKKRSCTLSRRFLIISVLVGERGCGHIRKPFRHPPSENHSRPKMLSAAGVLQKLGLPSSQDRPVQDPTGGVVARLFGVFVLR